MKSAYELAMERLEKESSTVKLSAAQKREIAEIDSTCKARIAERELLLKGEMAKAAGAGQADEVESLQKQLAMDIRRLQEEAESKRARVRKGGGA